MSTLLLLVVRTPAVSVPIRAFSPVNAHAAGLPDGYLNTGRIGRPKQRTSSLVNGLLFETPANSMSRKSAKYTFSVYNIHHRGLF